MDTTAPVTTMATPSGRPDEATGATFTSRRPAATLRVQPGRRRDLSARRPGIPRPQRGVAHVLGAGNGRRRQRRRGGDLPVDDRRHAPDTTIAPAARRSDEATTASSSSVHREPGASFACRLDAAPTMCCPGTVGLGPGCTFEVSATDAAGNTDATPATFDWTVDLTAPDTAITDGPNATVTVRGATFTFTERTGRDLPLLPRRRGVHALHLAGASNTVGVGEPHVPGRRRRRGHERRRHPGRARVGRRDPRSPSARPPSRRGMRARSTPSSRRRSARERPDRHRRLLDRRRDRDRRRRLSGRVRNADLRAGPDVQDGHRPRQRRRARRGRRDVLASLCRTQPMLPSPAAQDVGTITDDDPEPSLCDRGREPHRGQHGLEQRLFTVTSERPEQLACRTCNYATGDGSASPAPTTTRRAGRPISPPARPRPTVAVPVTSDLLDEPNETFTVTLSAPVHATIADGAATGTILDDDAPPVVSVTTQPPR